MRMEAKQWSWLHMLSIYWTMVHVDFGVQLWTVIHICGLWSTFVDYCSYWLNSINTPSHIILQVFYTTHKSNWWRQTSQNTWSLYIFDHRQNQIVRNSLPLILTIDHSYLVGQLSQQCSSFILSRSTYSTKWSIILSRSTYSTFSCIIRGDILFIIIITHLY